MRFAYADPPYIGCAAKHYRHHPDYGGEVDHVALIERLNTYDSWALSLHSPSLRTILPMCPEDVRVMAWVKPFAVFKPGVNPAYAWEPVIVRGARKRGKAEPTVRDWVSVSIALRRGVAGAKPEDFCFWLFEVLGVRAEDEFDDLFPGSRAVTKALRLYLSQQRLPLKVAMRKASASLPLETEA